LTKRLVKLSTASRPPVVSLVCPGCRAVRRVKPVGAATIGRQRREVVECLDPSCSLQWLPARSAIPNPPAAA
jgi:hypothetical protein